MKVLIVGADGQLGSDLCKVFKKEDQVPLTIKELDITDLKNVGAVLKKYSPEVIINTAAFNQVDQSEDSPEQAFEVNAVGVKHLAQVCVEIGAVLVHFSTDYVFSGEKGSPYTENDQPDPKTIYGVSKLAGEYCVKCLSEKYFIVRTSGLYGVAGCLGKGRTNFVESIIRKAKEGKRIKVVIDEFASPTYTMDLAGKVKELIATSAYGIYHIINEKGCSWCEFAEKILQLIKSNVGVEKITAAELKSKAKRPQYSIMHSVNLKKIGLAELRPWEEALSAYLAEKGYPKE